MSELTCGVIDHPDTCLCDVHITKPVDIQTSLEDNWVLSMVADYLDLSWPWDADKLGLLMEKSSQFIDAYSARVVIKRDEYGSASKETMLEIRDKYRKHYNGSVAGTLEVLGVEYDDFLQIMTRNHSNHHKWPIEDLENLVKDLESGTISGNQLKKKYSFQIADGFGKFLRDTHMPESSPYHPSKHTTKGGRNK